MKTTAEQFNFMSEHLTEMEKIALLLVIEQFHLYRTVHNDHFVRATMDAIKNKLDLFEQGR